MEHCDAKTNSNRATSVGDDRAEVACPLVSVVMPSLNQGGYIESAVMSVFGQGVPGLELVIADGGSVDGTQERLAQLAQRIGPCLRWQSEPDSGPANAVNKAIGRARGEILGWLNSDDLYAPDAIAHAVDFFAANPAAVMVYGEGEHIDAAGNRLGLYPTRKPDVTMAAFQAGCFICQPTVFLRRPALAEVGLLDEQLATAFDFDFWLRIFQRFPRRIGHIERVQAYSRLHADCITRNQRRLVAEEAVRLLARSLGSAESHWLRTHIDEILSDYPFGDVRGDLRNHVSEFVRCLEGDLDPDAANRLWDDLDADARLRLALPGVYANVYPDGWAPQALEVRLAELSAGCSLLRIQCQHSWPIDAPLELRLRPSWGGESRVRVTRRGPFALEIPFADAPRGECATVWIATDRVFVPNQAVQGSDDGRGLAFIVEGLQLLF